MASWMMKRRTRERSGRREVWARFAILIVLVCLVVGCAYGRHLKQGDTHFEAGQYEEALKSYEEAHKLKPDSDEVLDKIEGTRVALSNEWSEKARLQLRNENYLGAITASAQAAHFQPETRGEPAVVGEVMAATLQRAQGVSKAGDYAQAFALYESLEEQLPPDDAVNEGWEETRQHWSADLQARAREAGDHGHHGRILLLLGKAHQLTPDEVSLEELEQARRQVIGAHVYKVQPRGIKRDSAELVKQLRAWASEVAVLEIVADNARVTPHAHLSVGMARPRFETDRTTRSESVRYQSGTQLVENTHYKMQQNRVSDEERRLMQAEDEVQKQQQYVEKYQNDVAREGPTPGVTTGAEQNLTNARSRLEAARRKVSSQRSQLQQARDSLSRIDQLVEEPVYSMHSYMITTHYLRGFLDLSGALEPTGQGEKETLDYVLRIEAVDDEHAAQPLINVPHKSLSLPSERVMAADLYRKAFSQVQHTVLDGFQGYRRDLIARAEEAHSEPENVNWLAIYIVLDPGSVEASVPPRLAALEGIPDSVAVLQGLASR